MIIGNNMAKSMREAYWEAKRSGELIAQIGQPEPVTEKSDEDDVVDTPPAISACLDDHRPSRKRLKQLRSCKKEDLAVLLNELASGCNDPYINGNNLTASNSLNGFFLKRPQKLYLCHGLQVTYFVEKKRASLCLLKLSNVSALRSCE